jgi:hypothetical protein
VSYTARVARGAHGQGRRTGSAQPCSMSPCSAAAPRGPPATCALVPRVPRRSAAPACRSQRSSSSIYLLPCAPQRAFPVHAPGSLAILHSPGPLWLGLRAHSLTTHAHSPPSDPALPSSRQVLPPSDIFYARPSVSASRLLAAMGRTARSLSQQASGGVAAPGDSGDRPPARPPAGLPGTTPIPLLKQPHAAPHRYLPTRPTPAHTSPQLGPPPPLTSRLLPTSLAATHPRPSQPAPRCAPRLVSWARCWAWRSRRRWRGGPRWRRRRCCCRRWPWRAACGSPTGCRARPREAPWPHWRR